MLSSNVSTVGIFYCVGLSCANNKYIKRFVYRVLNVSLETLLVLLISYKLPFNLCLVIMKSIPWSKMNASVEIEISWNCIITLDLCCLGSSSYCGRYIFATP